MLVLSRKEGESIRIGDRVVVTVVSVGGSNVKLAFDADPSVAIHRDEVYEALNAPKNAKTSSDRSEAADD